MATAHLGECHPHGRDYYPQGEGALANAVVEHDSRMRRLQDVSAELDELYAAILNTVVVRAGFEPADATPKEATFLDDLRTSIAEETKLSAEILNKAVVLGRHNKGGWNPEALAIIYGEYASDAFGIAESDLDLWCRIDRRMQRKGHQVFCEFVNAAVAAYWPIK